MLQAAPVIESALLGIAEPLPDPDPGGAGVYDNLFRDIQCNILKSLGRDHMLLIFFQFDGKKSKADLQR